MTKQHDVIVVGGGASGMMAAICAARGGAAVLLLEKNPQLGKKLAITGGGRCNIFNAEDDRRLLLANYGDAAKFLHSAFSVFGAEQSREFFASIGLETKVEAKKRAFPASERAQDVVTALQRELKRLDVDVVTGAETQQIYHQGGAVRYVLANKQRYQATNYILATGGGAYPETGSTGDGFAWLKQMGHDVQAPTPNITPLSSKDPWVAEASGVTGRGVDVIFYLNGVRTFKVTGDVLFTHFGLSGPLILNTASRVAELLKQGTVTAQVDCFPQTNEKQLDAHVIDTLAAHPAKQLQNSLRFVVPAGMSRSVAKLLSKQQDLSTKNSELSKAKRIQLVKLLKALPLTIDGLMGFEKAVVADGGVNLTNVDTTTMQSKKMNNLYITGDLLHINRPSGGFSLQLCWTTGFVAGSAGARATASSAI